MTVRHISFTKFMLKSFVFAPYNVIKQIILIFLKLNLYSSNFECIRSGFMQMLYLYTFSFLIKLICNN